MAATTKINLNEFINNLDKTLADLKELRPEINRLSKREKKEVFEKVVEIETLVLQIKK